MTHIEHLGAPRQVLGFIQNKATLGAVVDNQGVTTDQNGKKIIKAGTPVGNANDDFLQNPDTVLHVLNDKNAAGIVESDVDVTQGQGNATIIISGFINENRIHDFTITDDAKKALANHVVFFKRS